MHKKFFGYQVNIIAKLKKKLQFHVSVKEVHQRQSYVLGNKLNVRKTESARKLFRREQKKLNRHTVSLINIHFGIAVTVVVTIHECYKFKLFI